MSTQAPETSRISTYLKVFIARPEILKVALVGLGYIIVLKFSVDSFMEFKTMHKPKG